MAVASAGRVEIGSPSVASADPRVQAFTRDGFAGPIRVFTASQCRRIAAYLYRRDLPAPADWAKARAVQERYLFDLAIQPALLSLVTPLIGNDVVLWGASAVIRGPGAMHSWHSDIESCDSEGGFVTAWIGIEETRRESALHVISRSHRVGETVQEARHGRGVTREAATAATMLAVVREREPQAELVQPDVVDGDVLLFDGRLWHGSHNTGRHRRRVALLLQYAAAGRPVRIPDLSQLDWPFRFQATPRPPVIVVAGSDRSDANRLVPPPSPRAQVLPMVTTAIHQFTLPVSHPTQAWEMFPAFRGATATLVEMSCHASVLSAGGHSPHPPHAHREEEILIPLTGDVEVLIATDAADPAPRVERLSPHSFAYYPAGQFHTIRNPGTGGVGYLMFKWYGSPSAGSVSPTPLPTSFRRFQDALRGAPTAPFHTQRLFEGPTGYLRRLHAHLTTLQPGAGYAPHVDAYDVAIVPLSGTLETLGQRVEPLGVIFYGAGRPHGMRNAGQDAARYLVFEFHAAADDPFRSRVGPRAFAARLIRVGKRVARGVLNRLRSL